VLFACVQYSTKCIFNSRTTTTTKTTTTTTTTTHTHTHTNLLAKTVIVA
jgi:hypothetical protein